MRRVDGRLPTDLRPVVMHPGFIRQALGSVLAEAGNTRVICTASLEEAVPPFLEDTGKGWLTAEYSMLPGSSPQRIQREAARGRLGGRTHEIQRLIGRSLRSVVDLAKLGPRTVWIDCDVIEADGGTRTLSITGAYVALALAVRRLLDNGILEQNPITGAVAAVSAGLVDGTPVLDLCYAEDSRAEVDMNFVMTDSGRFVEVQGTAEGHPFDRATLEQLTDLAWSGIQRLLAIQKQVLG
ncbi:MAG: ribonuclease PH [Candidatus Binatia bacterium]|nr:MAG: ribonuclease PH [Candidatus Binatia bacterium]